MHTKLADYLTFGMEKSAASALRRAVQLIPSFGANGTKYRMMVAGQHAGSLSVGPTGNVLSSQIKPQFQGMGLGKKLYGDVIRAEGTLSADPKGVSGAANRVWEGMGKRPGYQVTQNPGFVKNPAAGAEDYAWRVPARNMDAVNAHGRGPWSASLPNASGPVPSMRPR
jgi:hypothetical protein